MDILPSCVTACVQSLLGYPSPKFTIQSRPQVTRVDTPSATSTPTRVKISEPIQSSRHSSSRVKSKPGSVYVLRKVTKVGLEAVERTKEAIKPFWRCFNDDMPGTLTRNAVTSRIDDEYSVSPPVNEQKITAAFLEAFQNAYRRFSHSASASNISPVDRPLTYLEQLAESYAYEIHLFTLERNRRSLQRFKNRLLYRPPVPRRTDASLNEAVNTEHAESSVQTYDSNDDEDDGKMDFQMIDNDEPSS